MNLKRYLNYFTKKEWALWLGSITVILGSFALFRGEDTLNLVASLIGVTGLIFMAKGHPFGQFLIIIFSILYAIISYSFAYYGEMLTYLCMTLPMAVVAMITWIRHPYDGNHAEVEISRLTRRQVGEMIVLTIGTTIAFYFLLGYLHTANLIPSTVSVTTSFLAAYLSFRRNPYYAVGYAANDIVLIVLWVLASMVDTSYISVVVCFVMFLANDIYGFINWKRMEKRQQKAA